MIVLDTHIWLRWTIQGSSGLPAGIQVALQLEERVAVSAISCFEVAYLVKRQRIVLPLSVEAWLRDALLPAGIESLPITWDIALISAQLPEHHRDPADRLIIAIALAYNAQLASLDSAFQQYTELGGRLIST